jgi:hypothetical protein
MRVVVAALAMMLSACAVEEGAQAPAHGQPVEPGHRDVEQHRVGRAALGGR